MTLELVSKQYLLYTSYFEVDSKIFEVGNLIFVSCGIAK